VPEKQGTTEPLGLFRSGIRGSTLIQRRGCTITVSDFNQRMQKEWVEIRLFKERQMIL
jgi:hypothetical protein